VKYIGVGGASCLGNMTIKYFRKCILEYIDTGGASNRRVKYFPNCSVECIDIGGASFPGIEGLNIYVMYI
jgi:hypothetical protein